ncbi:retrovirus-related pol polyprotein from transposon TNT 1-94 [Tanacetum coccineum]
MTRLLEKETPFVFSKDCIDAFQTLKKKLTEAPILVVPDWNLPFELMCDASDFAIGAVLGQRKMKHFQPIDYASKTMTEAQIHYTTMEKEMLAIVYAFEKFRPYLVLSKSIVYTDHSALKYLINKQDAKPRLLRLSHLNFDYINLLSKKDVVIGLPKLKYVKDQLCFSCEVSKAKRSSFKSKTVSSSKGRLNLLHMDLCGPMRVASINGKKYILVIVDDYSRYTWTLFLHSKDETPEVLKDFLTMIQRNLQAPAEAIATACYTQNRSIIIPTHEKMAYHIINDRKPSIKHLHIFGCTCYLTRDGENLDKMKDGTDNQEKDEKQSQNNKTGHGMEKL